MRKIFLIGLSFMTLSACTLHDIRLNPLPALAKPSPEAFTITSEEPKNGATTPSYWWADFDRTTLDGLITKAFENNLDIAQAIARVQQARAITTQTRSEMFPQIGVEGSLSDQWQGSDDENTTENYGGAVAWELDLFGRIPNAAQADRMEALARIEDVNAARLTLSADIANAYFGAVAANRRLSLLRQQVKTDKELLDLLNLRLDNGVGTKIDLLQQKSRVAESESLIPLAEADIRVFENRLDILLGAFPDGESRVPATEKLRVKSDLPQIGIPTDLLVNRPDLRALQAELIAADADIAAAIADRLPRLTLSGGYRYTNTESYSGPLSIIMGSFVQPLIDWGQRKAAVAENKAIYQERLAAYTQAYLEAAGEVETTLYQENRQRDYINRLKRREKILKDTVDEAEARYTEGVDDYLPVLNALQELRQVERDLIDERLTLVNLRITLHRAAGGPIIVTEHEGT